MQMRTSVQSIYDFTIYICWESTIPRVGNQESLKHLSVLDFIFSDNGFLNIIKILCKVFLAWQLFRLSVFSSSRDLFQFWHWQLSFLELCTFWLMLQRTAKNDSSYDHCWLWQCGKVWRVASTPNAALLRWSEDHSKRGTNDSQLTRDERAENFKAYDWSAERYFCSDWLKWVIFYPCCSTTSWFLLGVTSTPTIAGDSTWIRVLYWTNRCMYFLMERLTEKRSF